MKLAQDMGYTQDDRSGVQRAESAAAVFLPGDAGERFRSVHQRPADALGHRQGHVAVHSRNRTAIRADDRAACEACAGPIPPTIGHNWEKATTAAARYIKDIYSTDAQASGLLVMASYNWGERRVINLMRSMPPIRESATSGSCSRSTAIEVPKETYDYVFYIVSAAVIGENPRLFGFPFDNPLEAAENQ